MFTECPSCESLYRIRAAQLCAADGWVRCGNCGETFHALARLYDTPTKQLLTPHQSDDSAAPPFSQRVELEQTDTLAQRIEEDASLEQSAAVDTALAPDEAVTQRPKSRETETSDLDKELEVQTNLPPELAEDAEKSARPYARVIWLSLILILSTLAVAQLAWFNRDQLLRAYPGLFPWVEQICESLQCKPIRFRDLSAIRLMSRQVSLHPRYRNALLVNATLVNDAEFIQPFPAIELLIFSTEGQVLSRGRFKPAEYLEPGIKSSSVMLPGAPAHLKLEVSGPSQEAVSFLFRLY